MASLKAEVLIKVIYKERIGNKGIPTWPMYIWELVLEQLVNGTPPSLINMNIVAHVKNFSPPTKIKELPSIWTIRRARMVLLVVINTLEAYRLSLDDKWAQLSTDLAVEGAATVYWNKRYYVPFLSSINACRLARKIYFRRICSTF